jgi:pilus assembly protein CpaE
MGVSEKIKVVIVDDIDETRENVKKLLQFESDLDVVGVARTGREGIDVSTETKPDVILMDINMPDMDGITATEMIRKKLPFVQIIILSVQSDPNYMRRAMLAGARDFLTKPPAFDELIAAIRRAGDLAHEERKKSAAFVPAPGGAAGGNGHPQVPKADGKIIVVYSPKGGTGCTTVATNLAVALKASGSPVVLADANFQFGDVAVFMNEQGKNNITDLASRADDLDPDIVDEVLVTHGPSGVKILAAPPRPEYAENVTPEQFTKVIRYLQNLYPYVIVDTDSALSDITLSAIDICDLLLLLITQEIPSIKNARLFLDLTDALGVTRDRIMFVMNRFDKRIGITPEKVSDSFKHQISTTLHFDDRVVLPSINRGVPFMLGDKSRPIARSFYQLIEHMQTFLAEKEQEPEVEVAVKAVKK